MKSACPPMGWMNPDKSNIDPATLVHPFPLFLGFLIIPSFLLLYFTCVVSHVPELSPLLVLTSTFLSSVPLMYINPKPPLNALGLLAHSQIPHTHTLTLVVGEGSSPPPQ